ncbi:MAG: hypothetical protein Q8P18_08355 [Pseudomonadota bacterium]|nr:hypothetical protein [Pseudomonadota bacterium]
MRRWWIGAGGLLIVTNVAFGAPAAPSAPPEPTPTGAPMAPVATVAVVSPFTLIEGQEVAPTLALRDLSRQVFGYNHDGGRILGADPEGLAVLDVRGQPRSRLACPQSEGTAPVDVSPGRDGVGVAALFANGRACVWDTASQALLSASGRAISAMALVDRDTIVYGYADGKLEGRNPRTGARRWTRNPDLGPIVHLRMHASSQLVAASTGTNGVAVVDTRSGRLVRGIRGAAAFAAAFDPMSDRMAVGRAGGRVELWNTKTWQSKEKLQFAAGQVIDVDFSPDGTQVAAATFTGEGAARVVTLEVWDFRVGELVFRETAPAGPGPTRTRFDAIGERLLAGNGPGATSIVAESGAGASRMWSRPGERQIPRVLPNDEPPRHRSLEDDVVLPALTTVAAEQTVAGTVAIAPDGARMLVRRAEPPVGSLERGHDRPAPVPAPDGTAPATPETLAIVDLLGQAVPLAGSADASAPFVFSPDGARVGAVVRDALQLWDTGTGALLGRVVLAGPRAAALLVDRVGIVTVEGKVYVGTLERMRAVPGVTSATAVALDPLHADRVAVGTSDGGVRILDVRKGVPIGQWGIHAGGVSALAFSADGRFLATAGPRAALDSPGQRSARIASPEGAAVTVLAALPDDVTEPWTAVVDTLPARLAFTADGAGVLAVSSRGIDLIRREVGTVLALSAPAVDAALSTGGLRWVDTLGAVRRVAIGAEALRSVPRGLPFATSADGRFSVTADGDRVSVWNDRSGRLLRELPATGEPAVRCVFDDSGDRVAVLYADRSIEVYEVESGEMLRNLPGPPTESGDWARFSEDGAVLWTFGGPREVVGWDIATGTARERRGVPGEGPIRGDESRALSRFVRLDDASGLEAWLDTYATSPVRLSLPTAGFRPVAVSAGGEIVAVVQEGGIARLSAATLRQVGPLLRVEGAEPGRAAAFSPDGAWLAVAYPTGLVRIWDLARNAVVASLGADARQLGRGPAHPVASLAFDAANELVLARDATGFPRLFEWRLSAEAPQAGLGAGPVLPSTDISALAVSRDGRWLYSAHGDAMARRWNLVTGEQDALYWGHAARITTLVVAAGGNRLVTGSEDGTVRAWEASTAIEKLAVNAFGDAVRRLAASADGWRFAALGDGGVLRTWDGGVGRALRRWRLPAGELPDLDLGPAGERLGVAFGGGDGATAWVLDPATGAVVPSRSSPLSREEPPTAGQRGNPAAVAIVRALAAGLSPTTAEAVTPDGATLVTAGTDGRIRLWDVASASLEGTLTALLDGSWVVDRPDGTRSGSQSLRDGTASLIYRASPK